MDDTATRLAVIEEKLENILVELTAIRQYIPVKVVEHAERIAYNDRAIKAIQWVGGVTMVALIGAFIGHVLTGG